LRVVLSVETVGDGEEEGVGDKEAEGEDGSGGVRVIV
jgi:hypothetical protein